MKRLCLVLAILAVPALIFAAGGGQQQQSASGSGDSGGYIRFAWWGNTTRDARTVQVSQLFMRKNPGVTVETEPTMWDGYWQKMNTQAAAGSLPDVMQQDVSYIKQYNDRGQLVDMNAYVQNGAIDLSKWADAGLAAGRLNGKLAGLVIGTNAWGIAVDPAVLEKAGITIDDTTWTWADYERIATEIFQKTGIQTCPLSAFSQTIEHVTREFGGALYSADEKSMGYTNNKPAYDAIKGLIEMDLRLKASGVLFNPDDAFILNLAMEEQPLPKGNTWNGFCWSNQYVGNENAAKRPLRYLMYPAMSNPHKAPFGLYFRPSQYISMLSASTNQDLAAKFVNFFVNDLEANRILLAERGVPVPSNVRDDLAGRVSAQDKYLFDYITKISSFVSPTDPPYPPRAGEAVDFIRNTQLRCLTGQLSIDEVMAEMTRGANEILNR